MFNFKRAAISCLLGAAALTFGNDRCFAESEKDDINATIVRYKAGVEANPSNPKLRKGLGNAYLTAGDLDNAIDQFKQAAKLKPDDIESFVGMARAQMRRGLYKESAASLRSGLRVQPNDADAHYKLGQVLTRLSNNPDDAMHEFQQTIKLDPQHSGAHRDLGMLKGLAHDVDGQIAEEKKALELKPDDADSLYYLGNAYAMKNERKDAAKCLQRCVEIDSKNVDAFQLLSGINAADGNFPQAIKYAETACTLDPINKGAKLTLEKVKAAAAQQHK
jgi:tetratricopeptide (TPR) repeat protein